MGKRQRKSVFRKRGIGLTPMPTTSVGSGSRKWTDIENNANRSRGIRDLMVKAFPCQRYKFKVVFWLPSDYWVSHMSVPKFNEIRNYVQKLGANRIKTKMIKNRLKVIIYFETQGQVSAFKIRYPRAQAYRLVLRQPVAQ